MTATGPTQPAPHEPAVDRSAPVERIALDDTSWVHVVRGFVVGSEALYEQLRTTVPWQPGRVFRYDRWHEEPRMGSWLAPAQYPTAVRDAHRILQSRWHATYDGVALAYYRDGRDSVAFHRDREMRWLEDTVVGILTLGARRPFLLRPRSRQDRFVAEDGAVSHDLSPAGGDLLVFGGRFMADWEHAVPKVPGLGAGRISLQWRYTSKRGRPEQGPGYRAPRFYGDRAGGRSRR